MAQLSVGEMNIAYERSGTGRPLLLVHGFPLDHAVWQSLAALLESDFDVIMPDLPGFGASSLSAGGMDGAACQLAALLDGLGIESAYVAGHSMGGYLALSFAHQFPGRVLGLGLIGSQAAADLPERRAGRYATAEQVERLGVQVVLDMAAKLTLQATFTPWIEQIILRQNPAGVASALRGMAQRQDAFTFLPGFDFPLLLVHGLEDGLIAVDRAREVKKQHPQATLVELPGVGHSPMLEAPQETAQALRMLFA